MKKSYIFIALAMVAGLTTVSCKCSSNKTESQGPTHEEVQEMKQALADTVLAEIDRLAEQYFDASTKTFILKELELTDAEKLVKPGYLLDPSAASNFVTKSQKVNALAIYFVELGIRKIYDMPQEETKEAIAKLAVEVNHPIDADFLLGAPTSEKIKKDYEICKERGDLSYFWQFAYAIIVETSYLLVQDPDLFFSKITEEQWQNYRNKYTPVYRAIEELSKYDEEMSALMSIIIKYKAASTKDEARTVETTMESAKQFRIANRDKYIARRNALLQ